jgi:arsenical pump membrane protein
MLIPVSHLRRLHPLDWLAAALLVLGLLAVATGLLPTGPASDVQIGRASCRERV